MRRFARLASDRLLSLLLVLWLVATLVFLLLRVIPGDPVQIIAGVQVVDPELLEARRAALGLDRPLVVQYLSWLGALTTGDLGLSIRTGTPVGSLIGNALPVTAELAVLAMLVALAVSLPFGIAAARRRGRVPDMLITSAALTGISVPSFLLGLMTILVFAIKLQWLPSGGFVSLFDDPLENLRRLILPAVTLGAAAGGILIRMMRRSLVDVLSEDYIRTAYAKGAGVRQVLYGHALRNAAIPYVTVAGIQAGIMFGGAVIVETIFALPGVGRLMIMNITDRDYPVVQGAVLVVAIIYVLVNFLVDLLYVWLDPRVELR